MDLHLRLVFQLYEVGDAGVAVHAVLPGKSRCNALGQQPNARLFLEETSALERKAKTKYGRKIWRRAC